MQIKVKDSFGDYNLWTVEDETERTYKVSCGLYITELYKSKIVNFTSEEIRDIKYNNGTRAFASFISIKVD